MLGRRGPLSKIVGGSIGLAKEYSADRKARKETGEPGHADDGHLAPPSKDQSGHSSDDEEEDDEELVQQLDEAQLKASSTSQGSTEQESVDDILSTFIARHPPPPYNKQQPAGVLSMPVILPQRRPESHTRGFVRAYAPVLQDAGIDQDTWIEFLDGFEKAIGQNAWFHAANAAVWVAGKVRLALEGVSLIARFVSMAIHLTLEGGRRTYIHSKYNKYLDTMNDEFFKPRGLYCLIIKYNPKSSELDEEVDVTRNISQQVAKRDDEERSKWRNLVSASSGKTEHEEEIPEFAPLVFPDLDKLGEEQKVGAVKHFGHFMRDYYDRQSQAKFDAAHEDSKLAGVTPRKEFASRYSDPNHPASQGGLISTISGGAYNPKGPLGKLQDRRNARRSKIGIGGNRPVGKEGRQQRRNMRPLRRVLKTDALYLMVVNLPTQEEMDTVLAELERANKEG